MRSLHVAALPFPSYQGTQALLHVMLSALADAGHDTHLLCYGDGAFERASDYTVHRIATASSVPALHSGPSLQKLKQDAQLARTLPRLLDDLSPDVVIAHHVEAAAVALATTTKPLLFIAHTSLRAELESYFPRYLATPCRLAGGLVDRALCRSVDRVLTVSPLLARLLSRQAGIAAHALDVPWPMSTPASPAERDTARAQLALPDDTLTLLYAGNLDRYQGLEPMLQGVAQVARALPVRLLLATQGPHTAAHSLVARFGLGSVSQLLPLASEPARRLAHAAADLVLVPRACPGGISIKLLDALARAASVIAAERAAAGFPMAGACTLIDGDQPDAWRAAITARWHARPPHDGAGAAYLQRHHGQANFVAQLLEHVRAVCESRAHTRAAFFRRVIRR